MQRADAHAHTHTHYTTHTLIDRSAPQCHTNTHKRARPPPTCVARVCVLGPPDADVGEKILPTVDLSSSSSVGGGGGVGCTLGRRHRSPTQTSLLVTAAMRTSVTVFRGTPGPGIGGRAAGASWPPGTPGAPNVAADYCSFCRRDSLRRA